MSSRGIRNNNPGNIRHSGDKWRGAIKGTDPSFVTFKSAVWGIRALAKVLITYRVRYGLETIEDIIGRWAPPSENDTCRYIQFVCSESMMRPHDKLDILDEHTAQRIIPAIIEFENGSNPYTSWEITQGLNLAGIKGPHEDNTRGAAGPVADGGLLPVRPEQESPGRTPPTRDWNGRPPNCS